MREKTVRRLRTKTLFELLEENRELNEAVQQVAVQAGEVRGSMMDPERKPRPTDRKALNSFVYSLDGLVAAIVKARGLADRPEVYYGLEDAETLDESPDEVIEMHLGGDFQSPEDFPRTVEVHRYARMPVDAPSSVRGSMWSCLDMLLEHLDDEHAGDYGPQFDTPTPAMLYAEDRFIKSVLLEYSNYWCESVGVETVNVDQWLKQEHPGDPDWTPIRSTQTAVCGHCYLVRGTQEMRTCVACRRRGCSRCWREGRRYASLWPNPPGSGVRLCHFLARQPGLGEDKG